MKRIKLTQGKYALIDDEDFALVSQYKWNVNDGYAVTWKYHSEKKNNRFTPMHRILLHYPSRLRCDHVNRNRLDNRRKNLRVCTHSQNLCNVPKHSDNTSGYKGVRAHRKNWAAQICVNYKTIHLGTYKDKKTAAKVYNIAAMKYHGRFAYLNKI